MKIKVLCPAGILPLLYAHNGIPGTYLDTDFYPSPVVFRSELTSLSNKIIVIHHGSQTKANQTFVKICIDNVSSCNECRFCCWLSLLERGPRARLLWELLTVAADRKPTKSGGQRSQKPGRCSVHCPGPQVFTWHLSPLYLLWPHRNIKLSLCCPALTVPTRTNN